ncbi:MAG TPA: PfkB family carbohydrate kinase [Gaiellaceae bacterium]|jgi:ribokinase|nr:PfkB family carbohydrate kinase [Gaiellaceae bacterium]
MPGFVLCTLGDLLLDVIVRLEQPLEPGTDAAAHTRTGAGGQAANVAAWAAALGAEARFVGKRGDDPAASLVAGELARLGVTVFGPVALGRNGVVVSIVGEEGERAMASDRGVAPTLSADELEPAWFEGATHLHLSGYSLMSSPIDGAALRAAVFVRARGGTVSVDLASRRVITDFGPERLRQVLGELGPELVFANEEERAEVGPEAAVDATWVLKRGAAGAAVERDGQKSEFPAVPAEVVDTTGAGDAFAAGYLVGGVELALETAARCISNLGATP